MLLTAIHVITEIATEVVAFAGERGWYTSARVGAFERSSTGTYSALNTMKTGINYNYICIQIYLKSLCHINN